jgi:hypothetical protein
MRCTVIADTPSSSAIFRTLQPILMQPAGPLAVHHQVRAPQVLRPSLAPEPGDGCKRALRPPDALLLCDNGENRDNRVPEQPRRVEVFFREGPPIRTPAAVRRSRCASVAETPSREKTVQAPEQHQVKLPSPCVRKHPLKVQPLGRSSRLMVYVLAGGFSVVLFQPGDEAARAYTFSTLRWGPLGQT